MEAEVQPKRKSNIPVIVIVALVVTCCCGAVILVSILVLGTSLLTFPTENAPPPLYITEEPFELEPILPETIEEPYDPSIPQGGLGDNELRRRVWEFIVPMAEKQADCQNPNPAAAIVVVSVEPDAQGIWEEGWTLFCENGPTPVFRIIFTPNPGGIINFSPGLISK